MTHANAIRERYGRVVMMGKEFFDLQTVEVERLWEARWRSGWFFCYILVTIVTIQLESRRGRQAKRRPGVERAHGSALSHMQNAH